MSQTQASDQSLLAVMQSAELASLDDAGLAWACVEPIVRAIRGRSVAVKSQVYARLGPGQRSLLMFWVLHGHASEGVRQFYAEAGYLLDRVDLWSQLANAMRHFGLNELEQVVRQMEVLEPLLAGAANEPGLAESVTRLDAALRDQLSAALAQVAARIRSAPGEYVRIVQGLGHMA